MTLLLAAAIALSPYSANHLQAPVNVHTVERVEYVEVEAKLTAYSCYDDLCLTASGKRAGPGTVGVPETGPAAWPMGTRLEIEGLGEFTVLDKCPGCAGYWLDVWQIDSNAEVEFGRQYRKVRVYGN